MATSESEGLFPDSSTDDRDELTMPRCDSVYSFMLYIPPLERTRKGHFCTPKSAFACVLFFVNVLMQVTLTCIAGRYTLDNHQSFVLSLVDDKVAAMEVEIPDATSETTVFRKDKPKDEKCCADASCAYSGLKCCSKGKGTSHRAKKMRQVHKPQRTEQSFLEIFRRPGGGGGKGGAKHHEGDNQSDETNVGALCHRNVHNGTIDCAPPSAGYLWRWNELDANKDGVWSMKEAQEDAANMGCHLGVPAEDVFSSACRAIEIDTKDSFEFAPPGVKIARPPLQIRTRRAIPESYFRWWSGLVAICSSSDMGQCGKILASGSFDGVLNPAYGRIRGGVRDLNTAMSYCTRILRPGGICDEVLPGTYTLYRARARDKCGSPIYAPGPRIRNPYELHDVLGTVIVNFETQSTYSTLGTGNFQFFMFLVILLWLFSLLEEFNDIILLADMCWNYPVRNIVPLFAKQKTGSHLNDAADSWVSKSVSWVRHHEAGKPHATKIEYISRPHHVVLCCMLVVRFALVTYMAYVGTFFLLMNHTYLDLLLNAVALHFVVEIDELLYDQLVSEDTKEELEAVEEITFKTSQPRNFFWNKQFVGLVLVPITAFTIVYYNNRYSIQPILTTLRCMCEQAGEGCIDSARFPRHWWDQYWKQTSHLLTANPSAS